MDIVEDIIFLSEGAAGFSGVLLGVSLLAREGDEGINILAEEPDDFSGVVLGVSASNFPESELELMSSVGL